MTQQPGHITLQTVNLWHPCFQGRWSSLLELFTGLFEVIWPFCRRTYSLELTAWWSAWSNCELCTISAEPEDVPFRL